MTFLESISSSAFMLSVVFAVLIGLYGCIRLFSLSITKIESSRESKETAKPVPKSDANNDQALWEE